MVEHLTFNQRVAGSNPAGVTSLFSLRLLSPVKMSFKNIRSRTVRGIVSAIFSSFLMLSCVGAGTITGQLYVWDEKDPGEFALCPSLMTK
jgi:hypothetical protein